MRSSASGRATERTRSMRDQVYDHLRTELLNDPTLIGTFLTEQDIARRVGASRTPVREALLLLAAEELVQLVPHRGAFVPPLTGEQIRHVLEAREAIESWAVDITLAHGQAPVQMMTQRLQAQRALVAAGGDFRAFIAADREFHTALVDATGNPVMGRLYEALRARHVPIGVAAVEKDPRRRDDVLDEHQAIVDGLAAGDPVRARRAVQAHLEATRRMLMAAD